MLLRHSETGDSCSVNPLQKIGDRTDGFNNARIKNLTRTEGNNAKGNLGNVRELNYLNRDVSNNVDMLPYHLDLIDKKVHVDYHDNWVGEFSNKDSYPAYVPKALNTMTKEFQKWNMQTAHENQLDYSYSHNPSYNFQHNINSQFQTSRYFRDQEFSIFDDNFAKIEKELENIENEIDGEGKEEKLGSDHLNMLDNEQIEFKDTAESIYEISQKKREKVTKLSESKFMTLMKNIGEGIVTIKSSENELYSISDGNIVGNKYKTIKEKE